jgi:hypothetical protein
MEHHIDHHRPPSDMFVAKYKAKRVTTDLQTHPDPELASFWIRYAYQDVDGNRVPVHEYVACDACITPEAKLVMKHYPNGWTELSKDEMILKDIANKCSIS